MKKFILLLLTLIGILIIPLTGISYKDIFFKSTLNSLPDDNISKWEYVKTHLFPNGGKIVPKFEGPILISLENASGDQKTLVKEVIKEIKELIPNKTISLYEEFTKFSPQSIIDSVANTTSNNTISDLKILKKGFGV